MFLLSLIFEAANPTRARNAKTYIIYYLQFFFFFTGGECSEGDDCADILESLENIDDDTDAHGMHFVTTEETTVARDHGVAVLPALALFRNGEVVVYPGERTINIFFYNLLK